MRERREGEGKVGGRKGGGGGGTESYSQLLERSVMKSN